MAVNFPTAVPENLLDKLSDEWYELPSFRGSLEHLINKEPPAFWFALKEIKDGNNKVKFKTLAQLMCTLAVLPHSSACVERVFSQLNIVKTDLTNKLLCSTAANRLLAKQAVTHDSKVCHTWQPCTDLVAEVKHGICSQRYSQNQSLRKSTASTITVCENIDDGDVVDSVDCVVPVIT